MTRFRAVIFDCDGVLVDSEPIVNALLAEDLTAHGLPLGPEACMELFLGGTMRGVADKARGLGAALPADWVERFYGRMFARLARGVPAVAGVAAALDAIAAAGLACAVGSNGPEAKMAITLGQHPALRAHFGPHVYSGQTLGCPKPDPGLFLHAARALGVPPGDCAVVDDSPVGIIAARAAGMAAFGYAGSGEAHRLEAEGATVFGDMAALPALLGLGRPG
jgi:HAD superfamily hydrolase (TIGR01509 family)